MFVTISAALGWLNCSLSDDATQHVCTLELVIAPVEGTLKKTTKKSPK